MVTTGGALPFADVSVSLKVKTKAKDAKAADPEPSAGITLDSVPADSQTATFNAASDSTAYLQFACAADFKAGAVDWVLAGTDKDSWTLSGTSITATPLEKV